jgi:alkylated DNA repair dioxygenase AlkB
LFHVLEQLKRFEWLKAGLPFDAAAEMMGQSCAGQRPRHIPEIMVLKKIPEFMESLQNLLPADGTLYYLPGWLSEAEADRYLKVWLKEIPWQSDVLKMFGKTVVTRRQVAWYGDPGSDYTYSGVKKSPLPWSEPLLMLKAKLETTAGARFNACLLNLYHDGTEGMGWHSDDEKELLRGGCIASVSLGAARRFDFRHRQHPEQRLSVQLEHGSLLLMQGMIQEYWQHRLPEMRRVGGPRINLTFRQVNTG